MFVEQARFKLAAVHYMFVITCARIQAFANSLLNESDLIGMCFRKTQKF